MMPSPEKRALTSDVSLTVSCPAATRPVSGIVPIFWHLAGNADAISIEVSCAGHSAKFSAARADSDRWFGVHSHLIANGQSEIRVRALDQDGNQLAEARQTLQVANEGQLAAQVTESLRKNGTRLFIPDVCDSSDYPYDDEACRPWFDRPEAFETISQWTESGKITKEEADSLRDFVEKGFIIAPNLIEPELVARINGEIDAAIASGYQGYEYGKSTRIEKLHEHYPAVRELWLHQNVMRLLNIIFQSTPRPCQTLTYVFGSQQDAHQDTIHLTPFPAGYMCGVWMAMQDVEPNSGELEVYVGSHRLPRVRMSEIGIGKTNGNWKPFIEKVIPEWQRMIAEGGFEKIVYRPKAGAVLIWHENLMHAGSVRLDKSLPRRSIVSHVFANGSVVYYDSSGHAGYLEPMETLRASGATA